MNASDREGATSALRVLIARWFADHETTARQAMAAYEAGAKERDGSERDLYLDYAHAQSVRIATLRELHASLDFDLFVGVNRIKGE